MRQRREVSDAERAWALGEELTGEAASEPFFLSPSRARTIIEAVYGMPFTDWLRREFGAHPPPGRIIYNGAFVTGFQTSHSTGDNP